MKRNVGIVLLFALMLLLPFTISTVASIRKGAIIALDINTLTRTAGEAKELYFFGEYDYVDKIKEAERKWENDGYSCTTLAPPYDSENKTLVVLIRCKKL